jgi:hypothetical protein
MAKCVTTKPKGLSISEKIKVISVKSWITLSCYRRSNAIIVFTTDILGYYPNGFRLLNTIRVDIISKIREILEGDDCKGKISSAKSSQPIIRSQLDGVDSQVMVTFYSSPPL